MIGEPATLGMTGGNAMMARGGNGAIVVYARMSPEPEYGAVTRIFVAAAPFTPPRGRAVRAR